MSLFFSFNKDFEVMESIGAGSFSKVYKVKELCNSSISAAKFIEKNESIHLNAKEMVLHEKTALIRMRDTGATSTFKALYETDNHFIIIMEFL